MFIRYAFLRHDDPVATRQRVYSTRTNAARRAAAGQYDRIDLMPDQQGWYERFMKYAGHAFVDHGVTFTVDVESWIDYHILVELAYNVDGFRLSSFMYLDRGGKINMGPRMIRVPTRVAAPLPPRNL